MAHPDLALPGILGFIFVIVVGIGLAGVAITPASGHYGPGGGGLSVSIAETNDPVAAGDRLSVTVSVTNEENETHTERITLSVGPEIRDSESVTVQPGATQTLTLSWETAAGDAGNYVAVVEGRTDSDATDVEVQTPAQFVVNVTGTNAPINATGVLAVDAEIHNTGEATGTQSVALQIAGAERDAIQVELAGDERVTVTLTWDTGTDDMGSYQARVSSEDDSATTSVEVTEAPEGPVNRAPNASISTNTSVSALEPGDSVLFEAEASDPDGSVSGYEWRVDGRVVSTNQTLTYTFTEPGDHQVRLVVTDDDGTPVTVSQTVRVTEPTTTPSTTTSGDAGPGMGVLATLAAVAGFLLWRCRPN